MKTTVYHNARCSKCRAACALLEERGIEPEVVAYLETPPTKAQLTAILKKLNLPASALLRRSEAIFKEKYADKALSEEDCLDAMIAHPVLIERPIVIHGDKAVIGRPTENILALFE